MPCENKSVETLGIYLSVPFCKAKCSFCNFASGVFAPRRMQGYVARLCEEIKAAQAYAERLGMRLPQQVDSLYFGGGTPSLLEPEMVGKIFAALRGEFMLSPEAEVTVECAPGQLSDETLAALQREGMNRLSFGVQSFVDAEAAAVGRLHTGAGCRQELTRMRLHGVQRLGIDLIAGLPGQTFDSWRYSIEQAIESGVEHASVYMLEVDEGSRLGRERLAGGTRYGAGALPADDRVADWYEAGCAWLEAAGLAQYEISNFARVGGQARHNSKYWERVPYLGFGIDAHSMVRDGAGGVRWANASAMEEYAGSGLRGFARTVERVGKEAAFEEALFLGLRLVEGVFLQGFKVEFGELVEQLDFSELVDAGLVAVAGERVSLTARGRMVSNEVFERLLVGTAAACS